MTKKTKKSENPADRPNALLKEIRGYIFQWPELDSTDVDSLVEAIESLDDWMSGGGPLPDSWMLLRKPVDPPNPA